MAQLNDQIPKNAAVVTPSATADNHGVALYCAGAGDVTLVTEGGQTVTFTVGAGATIVLRFIRITAATATGLIRMW
jgi:hypothetical protein